MSIQDINLQVVKDAYAYSERGDIQGFTSSFTPETEIHEVASLPYGGIYKGAEGFPKLINKVLEFFSSIKYTKHNIIASGNNVVSWGVINLIGKTTGKAVSMPFVEIWTIVDGKTQKLQVIYGDTAAVIQAVGSA